MDGRCPAARRAANSFPRLVARDGVWSDRGMKPIQVMAGALLAALLAVWGCTTVPETGRRQFNILSPQEEMALGFSEFDKMKKQVPVSKDAALNAMLQRVGQRIAAVASLPNAQWEFVLFESKEVNAFCLPGGKVGVYTGILPITKDEAGLATVIGHEVAHAVARHGGERMSTAAGLQVLGAAVGVASQGSRYAALIQQTYGVGAQLGVALPHSRAQEAEADHIGLLYMARAGYDPEAAIGFWQRFAEFNRKNGGGQTPWFLRTHPLDEDRIANLKQLLPKAKAEYRPK
jgi:predicted Zn-dependent protease